MLGLALLGLALALTEVALALADGDPATDDVGLGSAGLATATARMSGGNTYLARTSGVGL